MPSISRSSLLRQRFHDAADTPEQQAHAHAMLQLLLAQDGSATRLCETIAGGAVQLQVLAQQVVRDVPAGVRAVLPGASFLERITCLGAHGQAMMDNLSYIALDGLPEDVRRDLEAAVMPIGHMLARMWVRRSFFDVLPTLAERLWGEVGMPDHGASRNYCIATPHGPCMLIAETFRRGMRMSGARPGRP